MVSGYNIHSRVAVVISGCAFGAIICNVKATLLQAFAEEVRAVAVVVSRRVQCRNSNKILSELYQFGLFVFDTLVKRVYVDGVDGVVPPSLLVFHGLIDAPSNSAGGDVTGQHAQIH